MLYSKLLLLKIIVKCDENHENDEMEIVNLSTVRYSNGLLESSPNITRGCLKFKVNLIFIFLKPTFILYCNTTPS